MKYKEYWKINECLDFRAWLFWYYKCNTGYKYLRILGFIWED